MGDERGPGSSAKASAFTTEPSPQPSAVILERDIPALLVELGRAAAGRSWEQWSREHRAELDSIVAKYA